MSVVKRNPHLFVLPQEIDGEAGLRGTRCLDCGYVCQLQVHACQKCLGRRLEACVIGREARLLHHSVVHHPADGFDAPYVIARVRLSEGPRVFAPLLAAQPERLEPGAELRFELTGPDANGAVGFAYRPVAETT